MAKSDNKYNPTKRKTPEPEAKGGKSVAETIHDHLCGFQAEGKSLTEAIILDVLKANAVKIVGSEVKENLGKTTVFFSDKSVLRLTFRDDGDPAKTIEVKIESGMAVNIPVLEVANKIMH